MTTQLPLPLARATDPSASHEAARIVAGGNDDLVTAIRAVLKRHQIPMTAYEIAGEVMKVHGDRWSEPTIRTALARAGLEKSNEAWGRTPRGRRCHWYSLRTIETPSL